MISNAAKQEAIHKALAELMRAGYESDTSRELYECLLALRTEIDKQIHAIVDSHLGD